MEDAAALSHCLVAKKSLTKSDRCAGALSSRKNQLLVLHFSRPFHLPAPLRRRKMSVYIPLFTLAIPVNYLFTPWCRVLLEKLTGLQLVKKFPAFHGTRRFITALTSVRHSSLSWASPIQSTYPHPTSWRSSLILSTHLRLGLPSGLFPSGFPTKTLYTPISSPI